MKFFSTTPKTNLDVARQRKVQLDRRGAWLFPISAVAVLATIPGAAVAGILGASVEIVSAIGLGGLLVLLPSLAALNISWTELKEQETKIAELESDSSGVRVIEA